MEKEKNNYEMLSEFWRQRILQMDWQQVKDKLPELREDGERMILTHFGTVYAIDKNDGRVVRADQDQPVEHAIRMNIYNLLWYSKEHASLTNCWIPFRDIKGAGPFAPAFHSHILKPFAQTFTGRSKELHLAARRLGGEPVRQGDAGYLLYAFQCIPMQFLFWDADEEFPAQANILFDSSVTDFIHEESTVSLASVGIASLANAAGLNMKGNTYRM